MQNFLSQVERETLKAQHKKERDKRICDRIKAVLLTDKGWGLQEIADVLLLSDEAIRQHIQEYQTTHKLKPENGGSTSKLNDQQTKALLEHLQNNTYLYTKDIVAYIKMTFDVTYTISGITSWLQSHDFSYKKPAVVPGKANREAQEQWIKGYNDLKNNLPSEEAICFIDGVHPTHNTKRAFGWIRKGERREIPTNTGRQRLNLSGAVDIISRKIYVQEDETLNVATTIEFLQMLEKAYPNARKVHLFCDNARYYRNKSVQEYVTTSKLKMHFLPPYSPNLNPIERLWKFANERVLYNQYYEKFRDFKETLMSFFESLLDPPENILKALIRRVTDNFRPVNASTI